MQTGTFGFPGGAFYFVRHSVEAPPIASEQTTGLYPGSGLHWGMDRSEAMGQMRATCNELGHAVTRLHPLVPRLNAPAAQTEILKALFELTKQIEVVKKHLIRLEKDDGSTLV
jgi:hypothetical protein